MTYESTHIRHTHTQSNSHDTRAPGGAAPAAAAAARAGGRIRTGRSSDRLGGRCSVCQSAPSVRSSSAVRCTGKRGGAGTRGGGGEQASGPRAARRTGDRQAGDGPESDRAQRSERAGRRSAAADLEGVRSATVGVGGRPSCGEEGGRQVRVVRVALHRPVERHSSRDRAWATKSRWGRGRWEVGRDSFPLSKAASRAAQLWVCHEKRFRLENGANWAAKFTPRGTTHVFVNVVVAPRYVARVQPGSGGL